MSWLATFPVPDRSETCRVYLKATLYPQTVTTPAGKWDVEDVIMYLTYLTAYYFVFSDDFVKGALGVRKFQGIKYNTVARNISGLIPPGSTGINHGE